MDEQNVPIACTDRDGIESTFLYSRDGYSFSIVPAVGVSHDFFQFDLKELDASTLRVAEMHNRGLPEYTAKGIPDKMIEICSAVFGKTIKSSRTFVAGQGEFRTPDASKVWNRLCSLGKASYDQSEDRYTYTG